MFNKLLVITAFVLGSAIVPFSANAEDTNTGTAAPTTTTTTTAAPAGDASKPMEITKDDWLGKMMPMVPELICDGFLKDAELKKRFDELKMTKEDCVKLIPESATKCQNEIYASIPPMVNEESAGVWGRKIGECIGRDFAEKHLIPDAKQ